MGAHPAGRNSPMYADSNDPSSGREQSQYHTASEASYKERQAYADSVTHGSSVPGHSLHHSANEAPGRSQDLGELQDDGQAEDLVSDGHLRAQQASQAAVLAGAEQQHKVACIGHCTCMVTSMVWLLNYALCSTGTTCEGLGVVSCC